MEGNYRLLKFRFAGITITMRSEKYARLKAGIQAGLLASFVLGFVIWLFGYITGYRLAVSLLSITAAGFGVIAGAQVYISNPEEVPLEGPLAELENLAQDRALGGGGSHKRSGKGS